MQRPTFEIYEGNQLTDEIMLAAAKLFSKHYGVWGDTPAGASFKPKKGDRVRIGKDKLQRSCMPAPARGTYVRALTDGDLLIGQALACHFMCDNQNVCWITQLVVHRDFRLQGIAVEMLKKLQEDEVCVYAIASSHPGACMAAARAFGGGINAVDMDFIRSNAEAVIKASPVPYINTARLRGKMFDPEDDSGAVCCLNTQFWVDHGEPLNALMAIQRDRSWLLGKLLKGHEFLVLIQARKKPDT